MLESLKSHGDLHLARKIFHFTSVFTAFLCMTLLTAKTNWTLFFILGVPLVIMDFSRRFIPALNRFLLKIAGPIVRKHEVRKLTGGSYAIVSVGICYLIFPKPICLLAILFLAVGDPIASFFGLLYGKKKIVGKKSWIGTIAAFVFCSLAAFIFMSFNPEQITSSSILTGMMIALICGAIAAVSEALSFFSLDDNLTQPLVSSLLLSLLFWQLGVVTYG